MSAQPIPRVSSSNAADCVSTDSEFPCRGDLRSVDRVVPASDFSNVVVGEAGSIRTTIPVAVDQVLPVIPEVQVSKVHAPLVSSSAGMQHEGFPRISTKKHPHRTARTHTATQKSYGRDLRAENAFFGDVHIGFPKSRHPLGFGLGCGSVVLPNRPVRSRIIRSVPSESTIVRAATASSIERAIAVGHRTGRLAHTAKATIPNFSIDITVPASPTIGSE